MTAARVHGARQPGRRDHQRHRGARPGQHRPARRQAGDGRQGRACSRSSPASTSSTSRSPRTIRTSWSTSIARARADVRRHQPRGHQGARVLLHRAQAARAHEDPGLPRRPARHRDHRRRGGPQRPEGRRQGHRRGQAGVLGRRRRGARLPRPAGEPRPEAREHLRRRHARASSTRAAPEAMDANKARYARDTDARTLADVIARAPTSSSACRPAAC